METRAKYGNRACQEDGYAFASLAELRRYQELRLLGQAGEIFGLMVHPRFEIAPAVVLGGRKRAPLHYTADFSYWDKRGKHVEDVKSGPTRTQAYRMRRHLLKAVHGIEVEEVE